MRAGVSARWIAVGGVVLLAVAVAVLVLTAYARSHPHAPTGTMRPAPTFTLGVATPTPPHEAAVFPADQQRMLAIGSSQWWRATAGACGGPAPVIERSSDRGATWEDVTPDYLGIERVQTLDAFSGADAEVVAGVAGCNAQALRTFTRGQFWESYPEVLAQSRYVDARDAASVILPTGPVPAPCDAASGLRAQRDLVVLVCDSRAWSWTDAGWQRLTPGDVAAVAIDGEDIVVAHVDEDCDGVAISRVTPATASTAVIGCASGLDPAAPIAIDVEGGQVVTWSGEILVSIG